MKTPFILNLLALQATFLIPHSHLRAGIDPVPGLGARPASLGYAFAGVRGDLWSLGLNPAGLTGITAPAAGLYAGQRFLLPELSTGGALLAIPLNHGLHTVGAGLQSMGFNALRENRMSLAYATRFWKRVSLGVNLQYLHLLIPNYGSGSTIWMDLGLNTRINQDLDLGIVIQNATRSRLKGIEATAPIFTAGLAYHPDPRLLLVADMQKDAGHPLSFRGGIEYHLSPILCLRTGISTQPLTWNTGLGLDFENWKLDISASFHERLGFSPQVSLQYAFGHGKEHT